MWILDQDEAGFYTLAHSHQGELDSTLWNVPTKGSLKDLTLEDLDLLASMFDNEVVEADEESLCVEEED